VIACDELEDIPSQVFLLQIVSWWRIRYLLIMPAMVGLGLQRLYREPFIMADFTPNKYIYHHSVLQNRQCTYNVTPRHVRVTIIAVEKP